MLAAAGLWPEPSLRPLARGILAGGALFLLMGALFYVDPLLRLLYRLGQRLGLWPVGGMRARALDQLRQLRGPAAAALAALRRFPGVQALRVGPLRRRRRPAGPASPPRQATSWPCRRWPFALTLPLTLGGFGLREGLALPLFAPLGVSGEAAVAIELVAYLLMLAVSLVGGLLFLRRRRSQGAPPP
jgi:hypothetical protein